MTKNKKIVIALSAVLAVIVVALCVVLPSLYMNGLLGGNPLKKAKSGQIRVACVGDSLTYGYGISNWTKNNYPVQLGNMLGDKYCVNNFGFSGRTAQTTADRPYVKEKLYQKSLDFAPEIVVIMLGSNDTKPSNWKGKEAYVEAYKKITNSYLELDSVKNVIVMSPTPVYKVRGKEPFNINIEVVASDIRSAAREIAEEMNLGYIDLYEVFEGKDILFSDGAHPTAAGAKLIAATVYEYIAGILSHPPMLI